AARRAMLNDPIRLMLIVRANEARLCGPSLPSIFSPCTTPAQLTMPCSAPKALCAASTAALPLASSVTSVRTNFAAAPARANAGAGRRRALLFLRLEFGRRRRHQPVQVGQVRRHEQRFIGLG